MKESLPRVALVTNILAHYRVPCFEALASRLPGRIDFFLLSGDMAHRNYVLAQQPTSLPIQVLPGFAQHRPPFDDLHLNDPRPALNGYDLIIMGGWAEPSYILLWALAQLKRVPIVFWVESTLNDMARTSWKESVKRLMLGCAAGAIVPGKNATAYCEWLGMPRERIFIAPNAVDRNYFHAQADRLLPMRNALRRDLGLDGVVILFVGRMVDFYKRVSVLLQAQKRLEELSLPSQLVLIGEGEDRVGYQETCAQLGLRQVRFIDFVNHDELCRYYAAIDMMVLPSQSETWGFVLNEAMEFGVPIVTTHSTGAAPDLVIENENGFIVPANDVDALADALKKLVSDESLRSRMGAASRQYIEKFSPERWADGVMDAITACLKRSHD
jgi:glycosyltransferase involved in cell wall biosynthesis